MTATVITLSNPFNPAQRQVRHLSRRRRLRALAPRTAAPIICLVNGAPVLRRAWNRRLRHGDVAVFIRLPEGSGGGGSNPVKIIASLAIMAFAGPATTWLTGLKEGFMFELAKGAIGLAGSALVNAVLPSPNLPTPQRAAAATVEAASPTYSLSAQGNQARIGQPIPEHFGRHLCYPDFAASPYVAYYGNEQYLYQLFCIGRGDYDIEAFRIEDTPIGNFAEVVTQVVPPGGDLTLFPANVVTATEVSGQELAGSSSGAYSQIGTTITVTLANHGFLAGGLVYLDFANASEDTRNDDYVVASKAGDVIHVAAALATTSGACHVTYTSRYIAGATGLSTGLRRTVAATYVQTGTDIAITLPATPDESGATPASGLMAGAQVSVVFLAAAASIDGYYTVASVPGTGSFTVTSTVSQTASGAVLIQRPIGPFIASEAGSLASAIAVDMVCPRGLYYANDNGGLSRRSVGFAVDVRPVDELGAPTGVWTNLGVSDIREATTTPIRRSYKWAVSSGRYQVAVRRTNAKSTSSRAGHDLSWAGLKAYLPDVNDYGDCTLLAVQARATNNLSMQSSRKVNVIATRKLKSWHPDTGWSATAATRSIAWAFAYVCQQASLPDARIPLAELYALDQIWTARGDCFDGRFDAKLTVAEALSQVARAGRAKWFRQGGMVRIVRDGPQTLPVAMFGMRNIRRGSFSVEYLMPTEATADAVEVTYFDGTTWTWTPVICSLPGSTTNNPAKIKLFGITDHDHAWREGMYEAACNRYRRKLLKLSTEMEGHIPSPADLCAVSHDMTAWGQSGEVVAWNPSSRTLTLSEPLTWNPDGGNHYTGLRKPDGSVSGPWLVVKGSSDSEVVFSDATAPDFSIITDRDRERTHYAFGWGETWRQPALVTRIAPKGLYAVDLEFINDDPAVHTADQGVAPLPVSYSQLPVVVTRPVVTDLQWSLVDTSVQPMLSISWTPPAGATLYYLELSLDGGVSWQRLTETTNANVTVPAPKVANLLVRVAALGGALGDWVVSTGSPASPALPDVTSFVAQGQAGLVLYRWNQVNVPGLAGYEIRYNPLGNTRWEDGTTVTRTTRGTSVTTGIVPPGEWTMLIKAHNTQGDESINAAVATVTVSNPNTVLYQRDETQWWETGTLTNFVIHGPSRWLVPDSAITAQAAGWDTFDKFCPSPAALCTYDAPEVDLGADGEARVYAVTLAVLGPGETVGIADPDAWLDYKTSGGGYDGYELWPLGFAAARYLKYRLQMDTGSGLGVVTGFTPTADAEERTEAGSATVAVGGTAITFPRRFFRPPVVTPGLAGTTGGSASASNVTATGFTGQRFTAAGADAGGAITYTAKGV